MTTGIVFQVETSRVLQILTKDIYDSPLALLRENVQNAYDAIRMRFARDGVLTPGGRIDIRLNGRELIISDNGLGMNEETLRNSFWKPGSSGKHSEAAKRAGVVGTFGIGAMANFGVCSQLTVETRTVDSDEVLTSTATRDGLRIAEECITLQRAVGTREIGTTVTAVLDDQHPISLAQATQYLEPYVGSLEVPVHLNEHLISGVPLEARLPIRGRKFESIADVELKDDLCGGIFSVKVDPNGQVLVTVSKIEVGGLPVEGFMALLQAGGQLMGLRSTFGLAPVPAIGAYQFGGLANLSFLKPTAGREALSRESIEQISRLVGLGERAASEALGKVPAGDMNNAFLQWVATHNRYDLAERVTITVLPEERGVGLGALREYLGVRPAHYYAGTDRHIITTFASQASAVVQVAQANPRRGVQLHYVRDILRIAEVPDAAQVTRAYRGQELRASEASVLIHIGSILREDYLVPDADVVFAEISHNVAILPVKRDGQLVIYIARSNTLVAPLTELYGTNYIVFGRFMKDFVRNHVYPKIQSFVPSSARDGVEALMKLLERNQELYRYEEKERGDLESILGDFLSGKATLGQVISIAHSKSRAQNQSVSREQVGSVENVVPDVVSSPAVAEPGRDELTPCPPILRDDVVSDMKILTTSTKYPQLNGFTMLLGLSDRLMQREAGFFRVPHTTRVLWGGHRVIYIFTEATGRLNLYYDIQLEEPIDSAKTGGGMFPTTTLITNRRIFVPVPDALADEFRIGQGPKEFVVRFDLLATDLR